MPVYGCTFAAVCTRKQAAACNTLLYLCCEAPILLSLLPPQSLNSILATSRELRNQVHNFVTQMRIREGSDIKLLASIAWPSLQNLNISGMCLNNNHGGLLFGQGHWQCLETLHLRSCILTQQRIAELGAGLRHQLRHLDLIGSKLTAADLVELGNIGWPELLTLKVESVDYETEASLDAQRHAGTLNETDSGAVWPRLVSLVALNFGFHEVNMLWLAFSQFPNLRSLDASGTAISPSNLQILTQAEWPELTKLRLRNISVSSYVLSNLDGVNEELSWTKLKCLDLSDAGSCKDFDDEVCTQLALADWPLLERLSLRGQPFSTVGAAELVKAKWPLLKFLDICSYCVGPAEVNVLMSASWPLLEHLEVQALNAIAALLSAGDGTEFDSVINEVVKPSEVANGCWPNLKLLVLGGPSGACKRPF